MAESRNTRVPAGISARGLGASAVKQPFFFRQHLTEPLRREPQRTPAPGDCFRRSDESRAFVEITGQGLSDDIGDLFTLAAGLQARTVVEMLVEQRAELPSHSIMTVS